MSWGDYEIVTPDGSTLHAYSEGTDTVVLHVSDVSSFTDGTHHARIEIPLAQLRELFNEGFR